jgi:hypothetical protein
MILDERLCQIKSTTNFLTFFLVETDVHPLQIVSRKVPLTTKKCSVPVKRTCEYTS